MGLWENLLSLMGGLSLFLFGMHVMGDGLQKLAGNRLRSVLERMTDSRWRGLLLGCAVTAVMQSSSAVTVMAVGFVNAGIMELSRAVGVIMGANVGTTVTAWLLSLTHLQGNTFLLNLLKPSTFAPLLALPAVFCYLFSRKEARKNAALIPLGFAVLIFGMETMSAAMSPLAQDPAFSELLLAFRNPLLGVTVGMLLTAIIQSSSASVGILQALSRAGRVTAGAAIPIIMGQNIGTCVTTLLSAIGAEKNARRAAMIHLYFNLIGTAVLLLGFCIFDRIFRFSFTDQPINAFGIALIHSLFNLISTALLFPFGKGLERLAARSIPDRADRVRHER